MRPFQQMILREQCDLGVRAADREEMKVMSSLQLQSGLTHSC